MQISCMVNNVEQDMNLIRGLLKGIAADPRLNGSVYVTLDPKDNYGLSIEYTKEEISFHTNLLIIEGLIDGKVETLPLMPHVRQLTWAGNDLLKKIQDDTLWAKILQTAKNYPKQITIPDLYRTARLIYEAAEEIKKHFKP